MKKEELEKSHYFLIIYTYKTKKFFVRNVKIIQI